MKFLFYPAIALMNRLGYTKKFALLGLLFLIAIGILAYSLFASLDSVIRTSQQQLESITLIKPISRTVQDIQMHRGLSAALLGGNQAMRDKHTAVEKEAVEAFNTLEEKLPARLRQGEDWRSIRANWESLLKKGFNWTTANNFAAHTRLISQIQLFTTTLTQDTETGLFYLVNIATSRLPDVIENMGRIRAYGTGILASKQITEEQKTEVRGMLANLDNTLTPLEINFDNAARDNPALHDALLTASRNVSDAAMQVIALLEEDILTGRLTTSPEDFLMVVSSVIDDSYVHIYEALLPSIETQIKARIAQAENALRVSIGISSLLFLVVVYFSIGSYYATVGSIESLARSARAFAGGDMRARVNLGTHDELRQVGDSFNEMADGFNALLEARKHAEELLATENRKNEALLRTASDGIYILDLDGNVVQVNDAFCRMLGYTAAELLTMNAAQWDMQWTANQIKANIAALDNNPVMLEARHRRHDGSIIDVDISIAKVDIEGQRLVYCSSRDATERKRSEAKILNLAYYDTLTGLPNRALFYDRLGQEIKKAHRAGLKMALLFIDLDKFKEVNDTLGHNTGDLLLVEAAHRVSNCVREADTVARLGGDEFTVILSELDDASSIERVADNILHKLAEPFLLADETVYVSASIGITLYPDDATMTGDLLKNADQAMYVAKNAGRNRLSYFTPVLEQDAQNRLRLLNDLRSALAGKQFRVHYQPIVNLVTGHIDKAEALVRWQHPERGIIIPEKFIPLAEETGLIVEIGNWVFREAAQQVKRWRTLHDPMFQISVNKSPVQFRQSGNANETWIDYLRELDLPGRSIAIEITEGLLLNAESGVMNKLLEFRDAGMQVSIDDFGTGYSSLSYLKKFDIDYLKIDQSFVRNLVADFNDRTLSEAIIVMAHKLGLKVIAEGVETEAQRKLLCDAGCDYAQGYLFSRPVSAEEFEALLQSNQSIKLKSCA